MRPVTESVYDLREDEQLALAMQQSLVDGDPEVFYPESALLPDTGACPEEVYQAPEPPREPSASERPPLSPEHGDPEWAGSAEEAAGAPVQLQARVAREPGLDERALQAVHRSLDLAKARQFDEAERCLALLASEHPEFAASREMKAAREAVAMCKQLNDG